MSDTWGEAVCERCGGTFERKPGTSGRFCNRTCYEMATPGVFTVMRRFTRLLAQQPCVGGEGVTCGQCPSCEARIFLKEQNW